MSDQQTIDHIGYVDSVNDQQATVRINNKSACASCHAKGACSASDQSEKVLTVSTMGMSVKTGERVRVLIARRTGLKAVAFGYIYPFFTIMAVLIVASAMGLGELKAGLFSLLSLGPYYLAIYLLKDKITSSFTFRLEKLLNDV